MTGPGDARFRELVEQAPDAFVLVDEDRIITYVNAFAEQLYGWAREELLVRGFAGERPPPYDLEVRHKDGSPRILECTDTPVRGEDGLVIAVESLNRDVTWLRAAEREIREAHARTDRLLRSILPDPIVDELAAESRVRPRLHADVAVLFCDLAGFTAYCDSREPEEVVVGLRRLVNRFEEVTEQHGLQKIKTIGDAFMAAAGLLQPLRSPVEAAVRCGFGLIDAAAEAESPWRLRVGIHVGDVVAGVMGRRQFGYDLWGDTVNTAARMEGFADGERLALSRSAWRKVDGRFPAQSLGPVAVKGKGELEVFLVARGGAS